MDIHFLCLIIVFLSVNFHLYIHTLYCLFFVFLLFHQLTTKASSRRFFFIFISISRELFHFEPSATTVVFLLDFLHHRSCSKVAIFLLFQEAPRGEILIILKINFNARVLFDDWKLNLVAWIYLLGNTPLLYLHSKNSDGD